MSLGRLLQGFRYGLFKLDRKASVLGVSVVVLNLNSDDPDEVIFPHDQLVEFPVEMIWILA